MGWGSFHASVSLSKKQSVPSSWNLGECVTKVVRVSSARVHCNMTAEYKQPLVVSCTGLGDFPVTHTLIELLFTMATIRDYETVFTPEYCCKPISGSSLLDADTAARRAGNLLPEKE